MSKILKKIKLVLIVLLSLAFIPVFTGASCDKPMQTPLNEDDMATLRYYREATLDDDFEDDRVCVILKGAFKDLEEISFKDIKIVEKAVRISYVDLYNGEIIPYSKDGKIHFGKAKFHHMFRIVLAEHSKVKVLAAIKLLEQLDMVLCAEPDFNDEIVDFVEFSSITDPDKYCQWNIRENGCNLLDAWDITFGSTDVKVGVMEKNIDINHEDLQGRVYYGNFTPSSNANKEHGTIVAGVLGAIQNNGIGMTGVAKCSMYLLSQTDFVGSINYAKQNGIKIINVSFGTSYNSKHYDAIKDYDGLVIAAAGNSNYDNDSDTKHKSIYYPASYDLPNIISVGAIDSYGERAVSGEQGSNYGKTTVDLFAPGQGIYSTLPDNNYTDIFNYASGTSVAAPHVAGVAALIYAKCPDITPSEVKSFILKNVDKLDTLTDLCYSGGKLNAYKALSAAHTVHPERCTYLSKEEHQIVCDICFKLLRVEKHTFIPYIPKKSASDAPNVLPATGKLCTGCNFLLYNNGLGQIILKEDDKEFYS